MDEELLNINVGNKVRSIVSELLSPFIAHMNEQQVLTKKVLKKLKKQKMKIWHLNSEFERNINKTVPVEEFKQIIESLDTRFSKQTSELKFEITSAKLMNDTYSVITSDLNTKIKFIEEKIKQNFDSTQYNYNSIREFRDSISLESSKSILAVKRFIDDQKDQNDTFTEKLHKLSQSIHEVNTKSFPQMYTQIEKRNVEISEIKLFIKELQSDRVHTDDITRIKLKVDSEISKLSERFLKEIEDIKSFLNEMLRLEISCGVSDTLLKVLDTRHIKKLIPVVETQLKEDQITYDSPSEILSHFKPVSTDSLCSKTWTQTKNLENSLASYKERISKEEEEEMRKAAEKQKKLMESTLARQRKIFKQRIKEDPKSSNLRISRLVKTDQTNEEILNELDDSNLESGRSFEFQGIIDQLEAVQKEVKEISPIKENIFRLRAEVSLAIKNLQEMIEQVKVEFRTNQVIQSNEFSSLIKQKTKEIAEIGGKQDLVQQSCEKLRTEVNDVFEESKQNDDEVKRIWECCKMIHKLLKHDEEDRKSLQLTGYAESKTLKSSKTPTKNRPTVTLRPECLSCSDRNHALLSAFKMACLNYYPSDIKYQSKTFTRLDFIKKLESLIAVEDQDLKIDDESVSIIRIEDNSDKRAKSATKIRFARHVFDASLTKGLFCDSPQKKQSTTKFKY